MLFHLMCVAGLQIECLPSLEVQTRPTNSRKDVDGGPCEEACWYDKNQY